MAENSYWEEIERYFTKKRGKALILSPKDWPLVTSWQEQGVPLEVIYQGIDQAFARFEEKQKPAHQQTIRTLASCQYAIEKLWHAQKEARQAKSQAAPADQRQPIVTEQPKVAAKIRSVVRQLRKYAQTPHYNCIKNELLAAAETLAALVPAIGQAEDGTALAQIKHALRSVEQQLLAQLEQALTPDLRQELAARTEAQLTAYKKNMTAEVYQETLRIAFLQALRDCYPLPAFL